MTLLQAFDLAFQHHRAGRLAEAEVLYRQILAAQPNHADALHLLGLIAHQAGRHTDAVELIRKSILFSPNNPYVHSDLGEAYRGLGRFPEAVAAFERALELKPDYAEACNNLGVAQAGQGRFGEAVAAYRRALERKPDYVEAQINLGAALRNRGQIDEAIAAFRGALQLKPDSPEAWNNLGNALKDRGDLDEAMAACRRALALKPNYPEALNNLGATMAGQGRVGEAITAYRQALDLNPRNAWMHSNLVYTLQYDPDQDERTISEERRRWNRQFGEPMKPFIRPHGNDRNPERPLRVGYVSPDFRNHALGRYIAPLMERHDRRSFEILCYSDVAEPDTFTERFRRQASLWRNAVGVSDEALAETIRQDRVDILVDLSQHMAGNRLPMFTRKPAPVQVSFAGYPESAGLEAIEYRISDRHLEAGSRNVFLIDSFWCYEPDGSEPEVIGPPAKEGGQVTFGCLNNFCKINERTLRLWARVLAKVKDSHLILLSHEGSHRQHTLEVFKREGVESHRVEFAQPRPRREYLELYQRVDIALDTFPYNGHMTSIDALWMGVPVVSLAGTAAVSRAGLSQLTNIGLPELVAQSEEEYVRIAVELAGDLPRLAELRATMRARMRTSPLMDAPGFTRNVEAVYREMWQTWSQLQIP